MRIRPPKKKSSYLSPVGRSLIIMRPMLKHFCIFYHQADRLESTYEILHILFSQTGWFIPVKKASILVTGRIVTLD